MIKLFTHTDLDGVGCAILAKIAFGDDVDIEYCNYDDVNDKVGNFICEVRPSEIDMVYITDISIKDEDLIKSINNLYADKVKLLDHHGTAIHLNKYDWCHVAVYDSDKTTKTCGTMLFYKHLVKEGLIKDTAKHRIFVEAVTDYDTWAWKKLPQPSAKLVKEFNDLLYILGRDEFIDRCIKRKRVKGDDSMITCSKDERELLDRRQAEIDAYVEKKEKEMITMGYPNQGFGVVFADRFISELGNRICENRQEIDYIVIIDPGACKVSLRTVKDGTDVGEIAKDKGGGGHKAASGYHFDWEMQCLMIQAALKEIIIDRPDCEPACEPDENRDENPQPKKSWWDRLRGK